MEQQQLLSKLSEILDLAQKVEEKAIQKEELDSQNQNQDAIFDALDDTVDSYLSKPGLSARDAKVLDSEKVAKILHDFEYCEGDIRKFTMALGSTLDVLGGVFRLII